MLSILEHFKHMSRLVKLQVFTTVLYKNRNFMHLAVAYVGFILLTMKINPVKFLETEIITTNGVV